MVEYAVLGEDAVEEDKDQINPGEVLSGQLYSTSTKQKITDSRVSMTYRAGKQNSEVCASSQLTPGLARDSRFRDFLGGCL